MNSGITIKTELQHKGNWIKISIPVPQPGMAKATVSSYQGTVLKTVILEEGNNVIDVSGVCDAAVQVKVETDSETILKHIKLNAG